MSKEDGWITGSELQESWTPEEWASVRYRAESTELPQCKCGNRCPELGRPFPGQCPGPDRVFCPIRAGYPFRSVSAYTLRLWAGMVLPGVGQPNAAWNFQAACEDWDRMEAVSNQLNQLPPEKRRAAMEAFLKEEGLHEDLNRY